MLTIPVVSFVRVSVHICSICWLYEIMMMIINILMLPVWWRRWFMESTVILPLVPVSAFLPFLSVGSFLLRPPPTQCPGPRPPPGKPWGWSVTGGTACTCWNVTHPTHPPPLLHQTYTTPLMGEIGWLVLGSYFTGQHWELLYLWDEQGWEGKREDGELERWILINVW